MKPQARTPAGGGGLSAQSFRAVTDMFHAVSGIRLTEAKQALVESRLQKLAIARGQHDLDAYVEDLFTSRDEAEMARLVDKLTTNETYFFREPQHFDYLSEWLDANPARQGLLRIWSAASASGEEAHSIAMLLAEKLGLTGWDIVGTDLSSAMVEKARKGLYPMERAQGVPTACLKRWCRKGTGDYAGQLLVCRELRDRIRFQSANLTRPLPDVGLFDVIFLRNVLIYFDDRGKADIVRRVLGQLKPGGLLFTGHAESIASLDLPVRALAPAVYTQA